jgi:hypothetical protein
VIDFWNEHGHTSDTVYDLEAIAADNYNVQFIPTVVVVDRNGVIRKTWDREGTAQTEELFEYLSHLIEVEGTDEDIVDAPGPGAVPHDHDGDGKPDH